MVQRAVARDQHLHAVLVVYAANLRFIFWLLLSSSRFLLVSTAPTRTVRVGICTIGKAGHGAQAIRPSYKSTVYVPVFILPIKNLLLNQTHTRQREPIIGVFSTADNKENPRLLQTY